MPASPEFLVEGILPAHEAHLLGGSSGSGKTTFVFQVFLAEWQQGNAIFEHASHPVPYVYLSLDRSRSSVNRTLQRLGLTDQITRIVCQEDLPEDASTPLQVISHALKAYSDSKLIVIEGFQLLAGENGKNYTNVAKVLKKVARICTEKKLTVIGICHSPKMKSDERFKHSREALIGSVSWAAYSDTVIILDLNEDSGIISVNVMPRNAASEKHEMRFGENGVLQLVVKGTKRERLSIRVQSLPAERPITRGEILEWAKALEVSVRMTDEVIGECLKNNFLSPVGRGIYERTHLTIPILGQNPDPIVEI